MSARAMVLTTESTEEHGREEAGGEITAETAVPHSLDVARPGLVWIPSGALSLHPVAESYPVMPDVDFASLVEDIRSNGQREPVWMGAIALWTAAVDRWLACRRLGELVKVGHCSDLGLTTEAELVAFAASQNLHRRHLSESQRALMAAKLVGKTPPAPPQAGGVKGTANLQSPRVTVAEAAEKMKVSPRSVASAKKVLEKAAPEVVAAVEQGKVSVSAAEKGLTREGTEKHGKKGKGEALRDVTAAERAWLQERGYVEQDPNPYRTVKRFEFVWVVSKKLKIDLDFAWVDGAKGNVGPRWILGYTKKTCEGGTIAFSKTLEEAFAAIDAWMEKEEKGKGKVTTESTKSTEETDQAGWWRPYVGDGCQLDLSGRTPRLMLWSGEHEIFIVQSTWDPKLFFLQNRNGMSLHEGSGFMGVAKAKAKAEKLLAAMVDSPVDGDEITAGTAVPHSSEDGPVVVYFPAFVAGVTEGSPFRAGEPLADGEQEGFDFTGLCRGVECIRTAGPAAWMSTGKPTQDQVDYLVEFLERAVPLLGDIAKEFTERIVEQ